MRENTTAPVSPALASLTSGDVARSGSLTSHSSLEGGASATSGVTSRLRNIVVGEPRKLTDHGVFHKVSLVAVLAWVGLGADGLSSSCYGPEEVFRALGNHTALAIFVALACVATIAILCASYRQIIELFPSGGGGYVVASKLLSPAAGLVSGSALLVDYVLTISISVASGADALFSLLPTHLVYAKLAVAGLGVVGLTLINLRGARESVMLFAPIFFLFVLSHAVAIGIALGTHAADLPGVITQTRTSLTQTGSELGWFGALALMLRAFSLGAGTYTGIEAVSNGLPILREPRVETGKRTMTYMGLSLGLTVFGLLIAYLLQHVSPVEGKTLNAVLFEAITAHWPPMLGKAFLTVCLLSAAALLFIAAQAGFLDGPRVLANMALDRWFPARFATLSDRFVTANGTVLMGAAALIALVATKGAVSTLVVLYSLNVFLTFTLSQLGMVMHWWRNRRVAKGALRGLLLNGTGLLVTAGILCSLTAVKFHEGGWITLVITAAVVALALLIRRHYAHSAEALKRLDSLATSLASQPTPANAKPPTGSSRTAIVLVNGYNGLGVHTFLNIFRMFPSTFGRFLFVQVGVVDAGSFKGSQELDHLRTQTELSAAKYVELCSRFQLQAESHTTIGIDAQTAITEVTQPLLKQHPDAIIFAGQLAFKKETLFTRILHNYLVFSLQRFFCRQATPFVVVPVRV